MSDDLHKTIRPATPPPRGGENVAKILVATMVLVLGSVAFERLSRPKGDQTAPVPMPPLMVEGWLNNDGGADPTRDALAGRHVVVDAWATWCPPCRAAMPELAELHDRWEDRGVAFLGLTSESSAKMGAIQDFADSVPGFRWPIGYGAGCVLEALEIELLPTLVLFDPRGVSVWRGHRVSELERELERRVKDTPADNAI